MWTIEEANDVAKVLAKAPLEIARKYEFWKTIVRHSGPAGLRPLKGMHDEALETPWKGFRSSRLNLKWRVIYRANATAVTVHVERVTPHDYRR